MVENKGERVFPVSQLRKVEYDTPLLRTSWAFVMWDWDQACLKALRTGSGWPGRCGFATGLLVTSLSLVMSAPPR